MLARLTPAVLIAIILSAIIETIRERFERKHKSLLAFFCIALVTSFVMYFLTPQVVVDFVSKVIGGSEGEDDSTMTDTFTSGEQVYSFTLSEQGRGEQTIEATTTTTVKSAKSIKDYYGELKENANASTYFRGNKTYVGPKNIIDLDDHTSWDSDTGKFTNQWVELSTNADKCAIEGFIIQNGKAPGYQWSDTENKMYYDKNARVKEYSIEIDDKEVWRGTLADTNMPQTIRFGKIFVGSKIRLNIISIYDYGVSSNCGVCITAFQPI